MKAGLLRVDVCFQRMVTFTVTCGTAVTLSIRGRGDALYCDQ